MKTTTMLAVASMVAISPAAGVEHVIAAQVAIHQLQTQNPQQFIDQFKQLTGLELTQDMFKKLKLLALDASISRN